jgi:hypothetical protein
MFQTYVSKRVFSGCGYGRFRSCNILGIRFAGRGGDPVASALLFAGHQVTLRSTPEADCGVGENFRCVVHHLRGFRSARHPEHCNNHLN